jgi:mono/diheme cytochrome c family protein
MRLIKTLSLLTLSLSLYGCFDEKAPEQLTSGQELYDYYCKNCHATKGPGANMEYYSREKAMKPYKVILMIKYGYNQEKHSMPTFNQLSEKQADAIARHVVDLQIAAQLQNK